MIPLDAEVSFAAYLFVFLVAQAVFTRVELIPFTADIVSLGSAPINLSCELVFAPREAVSFASEINFLAGDLAGLAGENLYVGS